MPTFVVTFNGETTTFGPEHVTDDGWEYRIEGSGDTGVKWLWTWSGSPLEHADGRRWGDWTEGRYIPVDRKHHVPVGIQYYGDPVDLRRIAVIGLETAPGDMPTHGVRARYRGGVGLNVYNEGRRQDFVGDITLVADFSESTIGGDMDGWEFRNEGNDGWEALPGLSYTLADTAISGNGFTTSIASCTGCRIEVVDSTVSGKFYGPYADETGGTVQAEFGNGAVGIGAFYTDRD